ncbi:hypothetical protein [Pseudomonas mosselii]|uniref:hypothetical protein n=1 Tax=Pseudomonas mosselii TaxID=78327 RepID=UPI0027DB3C8F|nr:hypothetical protein [Pseudomonas mosselii]
MNEQELFTHYERIYFHELQRKEQIFSRLNIPLAIIVAIAGFYAVILGGDYKKLDLGWTIWFWLTFAISLISLCMGARYFIEALLGKMDKALATPNDLEIWRQHLAEYYADESEADKIVQTTLKQKLYADYMDCASIITINNERKSSNLYFCNVWLIASAVFSVVSYTIGKSPGL